MPTEKVILIKKLINPLFELIITNKDVYICQKIHTNRHNNQFENKLIPIKEIKDISIINEGIKILSLHIMALLAKEGCYLP